MTALLERDAELAPRRQERRQQEQQAARAETHEAALAVAGQQWAAAQGQAWNPLEPHRNIPPMDVQVAIYENEEAKELRRRAMRALVEAGFSAEVARSLLAQANLAEVRPDLPAPSSPSPEAMADTKLEAARHRTEIEGGGRKSGGSLEERHMTAGRAEEQAAAAAVQAGMAFADQRASVSERLMVESPMVSTEQTTWADLPADVTWPKQSQ